MSAAQSKISLVGLIMALASCAATPSNHVFYPVGYLHSNDKTATNEILTANSGEVLFTQGVSISTFAKTETSTSLKYRSEGFTHTVDVPAEEIMFAGQLENTVVQGAAYCTLKETVKSVSIFFDPFAARACFVDTTDSGQFDHIFIGSLRYIGALGSYLPDTGPITKAEVFSPYELPGPVPYTAIEKQRSADTELGVRFVIGSKNQPSLEVVQISGGKKYELNQSSVEIPQDEGFPIIVNLRGAEIEIVNLRGGAIDYRVFSQLDSSIPVRLDLASEQE